MILLNVVNQEAITPALKLLPAKMDTDAARVMLLAIGLQESRLKFRFQKTSDPYKKGPARGLWQFEKAGGVMGVMNHHATAELAKSVCIARSIAFDPSQVHSRLEFDDVLAAAFARLLLWADAKPLPGMDASHEAAWQCYVGNWRPGKPHRDTWDEFHQQARAQVIA